MTNSALDVNAVGQLMNTMVDDISRGKSVSNENVIGMVKRFKIFVLKLILKQKSLFTGFLIYNCIFLKVFCFVVQANISMIIQ